MIEPQWESGGGVAFPQCPRTRFHAIFYQGFRDGLAAVQQKGKWGYIDKTGRVVTKLEWDGAECWGDGMGLIVLNKKYGFVDAHGRLLVRFHAGGRLPFHEGTRKQVTRNGKWGLIDQN